ncbi:hypothetical protein LEQ41_04010 [Streptococcus agalactiae]|nr:hypothetical protein [Streptococcus agalactiae]
MVSLKQLSLSVRSRSTNDCYSSLCFISTYQSIYWSKISRLLSVSGL